MNKLLHFRLFADVFRTPTADEIAKRDLAEAQRQLLQHTDRLEYEAAMVGYLRTKVSRLATHVNGAKTTAVLKAV